MGDRPGAYEDRVEPLEPNLAVDKVQALARWSAKIPNDQVDTVLVASDRSVQGPLLGTVEHLYTLPSLRPLTGHTWAFAVNSKVVPLILKNKLFRLANWDVVRRSSPVFLSSTAPVAFWYRLNASEERGGTMSTMQWHSTGRPTRCD